MNPGMTARRPFFCLQNIASMLDLQLKPHTNEQNWYVTGQSCGKSVVGLLGAVIFHFVHDSYVSRHFSYYCFDMARPIKLFVHNDAEKTGLCFSFYWRFGNI